MDFGKSFINWQKPIWKSVNLFIGVFLSFLWTVAVAQWRQTFSTKHRSVVDLIDDAMKKSKENVFCYVKHTSQLIPPFPVRLTNPISRFGDVPSLANMCRQVIKKNVDAARMDLLPLPNKLISYCKEWMTMGRSFTNINNNTKTIIAIYYLIYVKLTDQNSNQNQKKTFGFVLFQIWILVGVCVQVKINENCCMQMYTFQFDYKSD